MLCRVVKPTHLVFLEKRHVIQYVIPCRPSGDVLIPSHLPIRTSPPPPSTMDLSQFLDVTCDEGESPLFDSFTEEDIVLLDEEPLTAAVPSPKNGKRAHPNYQGVGQRGPPVKKVRRAVPAAPGASAGAQKRRQGAGGGKQDLARSLGLQALSAQAVGILQSQNITVKKIQPAAGAPRAQPTNIRPAGSITWKYKQLMENQYTADIRDDCLI